MGIWANISSWLWRRSAPKEDTLPVVMRVDGEARASMFRDILSENGILSIVRSVDPTGSVSGGFAGPYEVMVREEDCGRAEELAAEIRDRATGSDDLTT